MEYFFRFRNCKVYLSFTIKGKLETHSLIVYTEFLKEIVEQLVQSLIRYRPVVSSSPIKGSHCFLEQETTLIG